MATSSLGWSSHCDGLNLSPLFVAAKLFWDSRLFSCSASNCSSAFAELENVKALNTKSRMVWNLAESNASWANPTSKSQTLQKKIEVQLPGIFFHPHPTRTRMQASKIPTRNDLAEFTAVSTDAELSSAIWSSVCHCNVCWELWSCCCLAVFGRPTNLQRLWSPNRQFTREKLERLHAQFHGIFPATSTLFMAWWCLMHNCAPQMLTKMAWRCSCRNAWQACKNIRSWALDSCRATFVAHQVAQHSG